MATDQPLPAHSSAVARPIPRLAPVTRIFFVTPPAAITGKLKHSRPAKAGRSRLVRPESGALQDRDRLDVLGEWQQVERGEGRQAQLACCGQSRYVVSKGLE